MPENRQNIVLKYLMNAGFRDISYKIEKNEDFVEIIFIDPLAIDYIIDDIKKTEYFKILKIKKFKYQNGDLTAIVTTR